MIERLHTLEEQMAHVLRVVAPITSPPSGPPLPPSTPPLYILTNRSTSCELTCAAAGRLCNSLGSVGLDCGIPASYLDGDYAAPDCWELNCPLNTQIGPEGIASCNFASAYAFADVNPGKVPYCDYNDDPWNPGCSATPDFGRQWCCHCGDSVPTS